MKHETFKHFAVFAWNERDALPNVSTSDNAGAAIVIGRWLTTSTTPTPPNAVPALRLPDGWSSVNTFRAGATVRSGEVILMLGSLVGQTGVLPLARRADALNLVAWVATIAQLSPAEIALARAEIEGA